ncbi:MAG: hypothetical protein D6679_05540 [Candidatus Hydrogenedentota bacterium]|nr:MAG: hypothetical protein D6679_05540 [Candidatus Hydrogenedentota bacterium]
MVSLARFRSLTFSALDDFAKSAAFPVWNFLCLFLPPYGPPFFLGGSDFRDSAVKLEESPPFT